MVGRVAVQQAMRHELHLSFSLISKIMMVDGRTAFAHIFALPKSRVTVWHRRPVCDQERAVEVARLLVRMYPLSQAPENKFVWSHEVIDWGIEEV